MRCVYGGEGVWEEYGSTGVWMCAGVGCGAVCQGSEGRLSTGVLVYLVGAATPTVAEPSVRPAHQEEGGDVGVRVDDVTDAAVASRGEGMHHGILGVHRPLGGAAVAQLTHILRACLLSYHGVWAVDPRRLVRVPEVVPSELAARE